MSRTAAYSLAAHYLLDLRAKDHGLAIQSDMVVEVHNLVDAIVDAAKDEIREELMPSLREASARANGATYP